MESDSTINWTEMTNNMFHEVSDGFMFLVDKIQEAAPYAWEIAQRQVWAEAISEFALAIMYALVLWFILAKIIKWYNEEDWWEEGQAIPVYAFGGVAIIISIISVITTSNYLIKVLINPDYYTILKILEMSGLK